MSNANSWTTARPAVYPLAPLPASALEGVRSRRICAVLLDLILVSLLCLLVVFAFVALGPVTLGATWLVLFLLPPLFPIVAFFYNGLTISGWRLARKCAASTVRGSISSTPLCMPYCSMSACTCSRRSCWCRCSPATKGACTTSWRM